MRPSCCWLRGSTPRHPARRHRRRKKSEPTRFKISPTFKELAEDAFDALERLKGYLRFTDMKLELGAGYPEAQRLCDKVRLIR
jgi:hypothetical protein